MTKEEIKKKVEESARMKFELDALLETLSEMSPDDPSRPGCEKRLEEVKDRWYDLEYELFWFDE